MCTIIYSQFDGVLMTGKPVHKSGYRGKKGKGK